MAMASAAFSDVTEQPYLAMVVDGRSFKLLNVEGEVPGSQEAVAAMRKLYGAEGLDPFAAFDLYAAAHGMSAAPPIEVPGSLDEAAEQTRIQLVLEQGIDSGARRSILQVVANARSDLLLDSGMMLDESLYDPELGADSAWSPETYQQFLLRAEWEPYLLTAPEEELAAALRERLASGSLDEVPDEEAP